MEKLMRSHLNEDGVPFFTEELFYEKLNKYAIVIPVINEGKKLINQLSGMAKNNLGADIIVVDGGTNDGSTDPEILKSLGVHAVLRCKSGLSRQMRVGFSYAIDNGYSGIVTIDGNGKDSWWDIPKFIAKLESGYDHIQGSRHLPGGVAENTPSDRAFAVKYIHAPLISLASGFRYTDTTNGFRGYSTVFLKDHRVDIFRDIFVTYNLHYYLAIRAPHLGYKTIEVPVERRYPSTGKTPTKISGIQGKLHILFQLFGAVLGVYNP
jgi:dolichol-phosphate mannosyltransferase